MNKYLGVFVTTIRTSVGRVEDEREHKFFDAEDNSSAALKAKAERKKFERYHRTFKDGTSRVELRDLFKLIRLPRIN